MQEHPQESDPVREPAHDEHELPGAEQHSEQQLLQVSALRAAHLPPGHWGDHEEGLFSHILLIR